MTRVTHDGARWSNAEQDRVQIVAADPGWPKRFQEEALRLRQALPKSVPYTLEHFGSTAVPGLPAKPIIDILLLCQDRAAWPHFREPIESLGYVFWAENPEPDHHFFAKGMPPFGAGRTHHLHIRPPEEAERHLVFRDALRRSPARAQAYAKVKRVLAERYACDREAYTEGKSAFVAGVLAEAARGFGPGGDSESD